MSDLSLIPPYMHDNVAGIEAPEYDGKLSEVIEPDERVQMATIGRFATTHTPQNMAGVRGKEALLVVTDRRLLVIQPMSRGLFGTKSPKPLIAHFAPSDEGNVFNAGVLNADSSKVVVEVCGSAPRGMPGAYIFWILMTGRDHGDFWAVNIRDNATSAGGTQRRPNGV